MSARTCSSWAPLALVAGLLGCGGWDEELAARPDTVTSALCEGVVCVPRDDCHAAPTCNPANGRCVGGGALPDGTACNDGNLCTTQDSCTAGVCGGSAVSCTAQDPCHVAGSCDPATGACSNPEAADGTACSDGDACSQTDTCQTGQCVGANPVQCAALDQCHVAGSCDPATGACSNPEAADGTACSDGDACSQTDTCQTGQCVGANPVQCAALDQCHVAGSCDPATGACSNPDAADGTACSDEDACSQTDSCQTGQCVGADPVQCAALDACHVAGACDPATGLCSNPNAADGTGCSDGDACSQTDTCQTGQCVGANPVSCPGLDQCNVGWCDPQTGGCDIVPVADGTVCNDGNACSEGDTCVVGQCGGSAPQAAPTRPLAFFRIHPEALSACLAGGPIRVGALEIETLPQALGLLWALPHSFASGRVRTALGRSTLLLARQLFVAECNQRLFAASPDPDLRAQGLAALEGLDCAGMQRLEARVDAFNRSFDTVPLPSGVEPGAPTPLEARDNSQDPTVPTLHRCTGDLP